MVSLLGNPKLWSACEATPNYGQPVRQPQTMVSLWGNPKLWSACETTPHYGQLAHCEATPNYGQPVRQPQIMVSLWGNPRLSMVSLPVVRQPQTMVSLPVMCTNCLIMSQAKHIYLLN